MVLHFQSVLFSVAGFSTLTRFCCCYYRYHYYYYYCYYCYYYYYHFYSVQRNWFYEAIFAILNCKQTIYTIKISIHLFFYKQSQKFKQSHQKFLICLTISKQFAGASKRRKLNNPLREQSKTLFLLRKPKKKCSLSDSSVQKCALHTLVSL